MFTIRRQLPYPSVPVVSTARAVPTGRSQSGVFQRSPAFSVSINRPFRLAGQRTGVTRLPFTRRCKRPSRSLLEPRERAQSKRLYVGRSESLPSSSVSQSLTNVSIVSSSMLSKPPSRTLSIAILNLPFGKKNVEVSRNESKTLTRKQLLI